MINKKNIQILLIALFLLPALLRGQEKLTLSDAISLGLKNNYSVQIVENTKKIAENNDSWGNAGLLPRLDAAAGVNYQNNNIDMEIATGPQPMKISQTGNVSKGYNANIQLSWTLFDGFAMFINKNKFEELRHQSDLQMQMAMEAMIRDLANQYYEAIRLRKEIDIMKESIAISRERLKRVEDRADFGAALSVEVMKAEVDLNVDSTRFLQSKLMLSAALRNLNFLLGEEIDSEYALDTNVTIENDYDLKALHDQTMSKNSSLNQALSEKKISELDYESVSAMYYPQISLSSSYGINHTESDGGFITKNRTVGFNAGLNAQMNLFNGFRTDIRSENAAVNVMINEIKIKEIRRQLELALKNAYENYRQRLIILEIENENMIAAKETFQRTRELFDMGQASSIDFRDTQLNYQKAKNRINNAKYQIKLAEIELMILSGNMF